ncbi:ABC transporter ATP-binding protein [bacterium]|nr:ABC transporter ATP-binding protein [bacterium]
MIYPRGVKALDQVSLEVRRGEWLTVMGPSGSGKTTLLNILDGLDKPTAGHVRVFDTDVTRLTQDDAAVFRRENLGLVFQQFHLMPYLTALENVVLAQYYHSMVDRRQAMEFLASVEMADRANHLPSQLSGGEQQRVCIARALINDPCLILADEPTGNLDEKNEEKVLEIFHQLHREGKTLIVVTHDRSVADLAERTIHLQHGRLVEFCDAPSAF